MQIEESCRYLKSERFEWDFPDNRSTQRNRLGELLLIACLALFVLRLIGKVGKIGIPIPKQRTAFAPSAIGYFTGLATCATWESNLPAT